MIPCEPGFSDGESERAVYENTVRAGRGAKRRPRNTDMIAPSSRGGQETSRCSSHEGAGTRAEYKAPRNDLCARKRHHDVERTPGASESNGDSSGSSQDVELVSSKSEQDFEKALEALRESGAISPRAPMDAVAGSKQEDAGGSTLPFGVFNDPEDAPGVDSFEAGLLWLSSVQQDTASEGGGDSDFEPLHLLSL